MARAITHSHIVVAIGIYSEVSRIVIKLLGNLGKFDLLLHRLERSQVIGISADKNLEILRITGRESLHVHMETILHTILHGDLRKNEPIVGIKRILVILYVVNAHLATVAITPRRACAVIVDSLEEVIESGLILKRLTVRHRKSVTTEHTIGFGHSRHMTVVDSGNLIIVSLQGLRGRFAERCSLQSGSHLNLARHTHHVVSEVVEIDVTLVYATLRHLPSHLIDIVIELHGRFARSKRSIKTCILIYITHRRETDSIVDSYIHIMITLGKSHRYRLRRTRGHIDTLYIFAIEPHVEIDIT